MWDRSNYYENVDRQILVSRAKLFGFDMVSLRLSLAMAASDRYVTMGGLVQKAGKPKVGIIAGDFFATYSINAYVKAPVKEFMDENPDVQMHIMVDDW